MRYVYVLISEIDGQLYVGSTFNVNKRIKEHNSGKVPATSDRLPLKVIHYEAFLNKYDAYFREKWLKTGWGRRYLRKTLHNAIKSLGG
jgi:putative endonuclease